MNEARPDQDVAAHRRRHSPVPVSVVVPAFNAEPYVEQQLRALRDQDEPWLREVVVVDNRSTDGTARVVEDFAFSWPKVRLLDEPRPGGNIARNRGVVASSADHVLLCDADDVVGKGWMRALNAALLDYDLVRGRYELTRLNPPDVVAARGPMASTGPPPPGHPVNGLGGNCGFRRAAWHRLGGMAEHHYGSDDDEFFWRAQLAELRVGYAADAVVHYRLRTSLADLYRQQKNWASNRAQLYREFGARGFISRRTLPQAMKSWIWLAVHVRDARSTDPARKGRWIRVAAANVGRAQGSVRHRARYP